MDEDTLTLPGEWAEWGLDLGVWGKSDGLPPGVVYPLVGHLLDVAAVAWCLWEEHLAEPQRRVVVRGLGLNPAVEGDRRRARGLVACWSGWHDLGKVTWSFQAKDRIAFGRLSGYPAARAEAPRVSHGWATHLALVGELPGLGYDARGEGLAVASPALRLAQMLGGHHGRFFRPPSRREATHAGLRERSLGGEKWAEQRAAHLGAVAAMVGETAGPAALSVGAAVVAAEVVVVADWLASQKQHVLAQLESARMAGGWVVREHWERALDAAPGLIAGAGLGMAQWTETPRA